MALFVQANPRNLFIVQSAARLSNYIHKLTGNALLIGSTGYYVAHECRHGVSKGQDMDQSDFKRKYPSRPKVG